MSCTSYKVFNSNNQAYVTYTDCDGTLHENELILGTSVGYCCICNNDAYGAPVDGISNTGDTTFIYDDTCYPTAPDITWASEPGTVNTGEFYNIAAVGSSLGGHLATVNIDKSFDNTNWAPFAYVGPGDGNTSNSNNDDSASNPSTAQVYYRAWATDTFGLSSSFIFQTVNIAAAPTISWSTTPGTVESGETFTITATGASEGGYLDAVSIDYSYDNSTWIPFAYAGGGDGYTGTSSNPFAANNPPNSVVYFRAWSEDTRGQNSGYITQTVNINPVPPPSPTPAPSPVRYTLTVALQNGAGTTGGSGSYFEGTALQISVAPGSGWAFVRWEDSSGGVINIYNNPGTTYMPGYDHTIYAVLIAIPPSPSVSPAPSGLPNYTLSVQTSPGLHGTTTGSGTYVTGTNITISVTPDANYTFSYWLDSTGNIPDIYANPGTFNSIAGNATIYAVLTYIPPPPTPSVTPSTSTPIPSVTPSTSIPYYSILAYSSGFGDVYLDGSDTQGDPISKPAGTYTLVAQPTAGYIFSEWVFDNGSPPSEVTSSTNASTYIIVAGDCAISAVFTPSPTPSVTPSTSTPPPTPSVTPSTSGAPGASITPSPSTSTPPPTPTPSPSTSTPPPTPTTTPSTTPPPPTPTTTPSTTPPPPTPSVSVSTPIGQPNWVMPKDIKGIIVNVPVTGVYTFATPIECSIDRVPYITDSLISKFYNIVWYWGDNTSTENEFTPSHVYNWPGVYEVKLVLYNSLSADTVPPYRRTFSTTVTAVNFVKDELTWDYTNWSDLTPTKVSNGACFHGFQSCKTGTVTGGPIPLTVNYYTTIKDNESVNFNFYADNSLSQPWTEVPDSQLANLRPRWRFTTVSATPLDDGAIITEFGYTPVSSTEIRILSSGVLSDTGTLVGLSGSFQVYYIDDMPSMVYNNTAATVSATPTTIWVNLNTINLPNPQEYEYDVTAPSYSNTIVSLSSYFYVESLSADHLNVTLNGEVAFNETYWPGVESRFVTTVNSKVLSGTGEFLSNKILLNYPVYSPNTYTIVAVSGTSVSGVSAIFNTSTTPTSANILRYTINKTDSLNRNTGGYYIGTFTPYTTGTLLLSATTTALMVILLDLLPSTTTGFNPLTISPATSSFNLKLISGTSDSFNVVDFDSVYFARKFGAAFDYGAQLKEYALQPTINQNEVFFDTYLPAVAGVSATTEDTFGGVVFEKIANFVPNTVDISKANVSQFYSLAQALGVELDNFDYDIPPTLSRIVDTYSTQQSTVWGARSQFARNFSNNTQHVNLGAQLSGYNIATAIVSAGQKIVVSDVFTPQVYELLEVPAITSYSSISARNLQSLFPANIQYATYPITVYPLSAFFGWGLNTPVANYYRFFVYNDTVDNTQSEGLINWDDPYTTLSENASAHAEWVKDGGTLETIYNYYIHKGLGLIK